MIAIVKIGNHFSWKNASGHGRCSEVRANARIENALFIVEAKTQ
jgi:hypothetical protein